MDDEWAPGLKSDVAVLSYWLSSSLPKDSHSVSDVYAQVELRTVETFSPNFTFFRPQDVQCQGESADFSVEKDW